MWGEGVSANQFDEKTKGGTNDIMGVVNTNFYFYANTFKISIKIMFKLLVFKSTNNSFTSSLGRFFTYKYWLDLLCKSLIPFSFFHLTFTSCTTYKLVFSKNIQTWKEWYTLKIRRKENVAPFPFKTPFEQQY